MPMAIRLCVLSLAVWGALPTSIFAQVDDVPRVVVLRFEGWRSERARDVVLAEIASYVELVDESRAVATAGDLGVDVSTPEGMQQVVEHLGVSAVIAGSVEGRGRNAETIIIVVDAQANELSRRVGPSPQRASDHPAIGAAAIEALNEALAVLERQRAEEEAAEAAAAPPAESTDPEEGVGMDFVVDPDTSGWQQRLFTVLGGLRLRTVGTYIDDAAFRQHFFSSDMFPEIAIYGIVRPFLEFDTVELRGLLFQLQTSFSVGINYVRADGAERGMTSFRFRLDVGYGYVIEDIFEIIGLLGYALDGVALDEPDGFVSTAFSSLRPGVMGRFRAYEDYVIVEAGIGARIGIDGGDLAVGYGPSLFFGGVDLFVGVAGRIELGLSWAVRFGYTHYALSFSGTGGIRGTGTSGTDEAVDVQLLLGYSM